ncbi:MAG: hypothetical protein G01um101425_84 [Candidatus Peregrinibacteria bacterium Gr01-1014_25]|nr:MAG: hypothetical protein G01um101425_84 [Candidatus Peregrinibacteria bacterium Gr01-1014_25]
MSQHPASPVSRLLRRAQNALRVLVLRPLAAVYIAIEYGVLLLTHRKELMRAGFVTPLWFWSFGHQAIDPHMLAMRFRGKKLLIVVSDYGNMNPYLVGTFEQYVRMCYLRHSRFMGMLRPLFKHEELRALKIAVLRFVLRVLGHAASIVPTYHEHQGSVIEGTFITERLRLFQQHADMPLIPLTEPIERFRSLLQKTHPELAGKWFVALYLRRTVKVGDEMRDTDPATFADVIGRIRGLGGFVFCGGDYDDAHAVFPGMQGVMGYSDFPCERELTDYYGITQCRFLVGPTSGPVSIAMSFNIPNLMTNDPFYYHSGNRENQIVLHRKLRDRATGRILAARETFSPPIIAYRTKGEFERAGLEHIDNTKEEIAAALEEMVQRHILGHDTVLPEHQPLYDRFKSLLPKESIIYQSPSRPALIYLQNLVW